MSVNKTDISQIRKYLKGELDGHGMNELERQAVDDPFMRDALEGYELAGADHEAHLHKLAAQLHRRVRKVKKPVKMWSFIAAAACVLVLLTISGLWFFHHNSVNKPLASLNDKTAVEKQVKEVPLSIQNEAPQVAADKRPELKPYRKGGTNRYTPPVAADTVEQMLANTPVASAEAKSLADVNQDDSVSETAMYGYFNKSKLREVTTSPLALKSAEKEEESLKKALQGMVAGVQTTQAAHPTLVKGVVRDLQDKMPLPGVSVRVEGAQVATQTNAAGEYTINVPDVKSYLLFDYIGYERKRAKIRAEDSLNVALKSDNRALSEVVVSGYSSNQPAIKEAHPRTGWDNFNKYLKQEAKSPDGKKGTVRLSFVVNADGELSDFKILKSVSKQTDRMAIDLVENGPEWMPDTDSKAKEIKLKIKFP